MSRRRIFWMCEPVWYAVCDGYVRGREGGRAMYCRPIPGQENEQVYSALLVLYCGILRPSVPSPIDLNLLTFYYLNMMVGGWKFGKLSSCYYALQASHVLANHRESDRLLWALLISTCAPEQSIYEQCLPRVGSLYYDCMTVTTMYVWEAGRGSVAEIIVLYWPSFCDMPPDMVTFCNLEEYSPMHCDILEWALIETSYSVNPVMSSNVWLIIIIIAFWKTIDLNRGRLSVCHRHGGNMLLCYYCVLTLYILQWRERQEVKAVTCEQTLLCVVCGDMTWLLFLWWSDPMTSLFFLMSVQWWYSFIVFHEQKKTLLYLSQTIRQAEGAGKTDLDSN